MRRLVAWPGVLAVAVLVAGCASGGESPGSTTSTSGSTSPAGTLPAASPAPSDLPVPPGTGDVWRSVAVPASEPDRWPTTVVAVAAGPSGHVAVGGVSCRQASAAGGALVASLVAEPWQPGDSVPPEPDDCRLGIVRSETGDAWSTVPRQASLSTDLVEAAVGSLDRGFIDVAWGPAGFLAIGRTAGEGADGVGVWTSTDGVTWELGATEAPFARQRPAAIAAGPQGYVVVGTDVGTLDIRHERPWAAAWFSPDGRTWIRTGSDDVGAFFDTMEEPGYGGMRVVTAHPAGGFVAAGVALDEAGQNPRTVAWRSPDGLSWTRMPGVPPSAGYPRAIAALGTTILVVIEGIDEMRATSIVRATEPYDAWESSPSPGPDRLLAVAAVGDRFVLVGADDGRPVVRTGSDGIAWVERPIGVWVGSGDAIEGADIAVGSGHAVIAGWDWEREPFLLVSP